MFLPKPCNILLTRPLLSESSRLLQAAFDRKAINLVSWKDDCTAKRSWLLENLKGKEIHGIICMLGDKIDTELLDEAGSSLKVVSTMSAGYDHIDHLALKERGIQLRTAPDSLTDATADVGALLVLMTTRRIGESFRAVISGEWPNMPWSPSLLCGRAIQKSTLGVLGFGKIGQLTAKRLLSFGISRIIYSTSQPGQPLSPEKDYFGLIDQSQSLGINLHPAESLETLARDSDVLLVSCALTKGTHHLINEEFLSKMKPTAYLINTARGPIVDTSALISAVQQGKLAGAGLDVLEGEPNVPPDHPILKVPQIVVLPHIGSATWEARQGMGVDAVRGCFEVLGLPL